MCDGCPGCPSAADYIINSVPLRVLTVNFVAIPGATPS
jgi:hypothetical protein